MCRCILSQRGVGYDNLQIGYEILIQTMLKQFSNRTGYSDDANNKYHVGTRLQFGSDLKFDIESFDNNSPEGVESQVMLLN